MGVGEERKLQSLSNPPRGSWSSSIHVIDDVTGAMGDRAIPRYRKPTLLVRISLHAEIAFLFSAAENRVTRGDVVVTSRRRG